MSEPIIINSNETKALPARAFICYIKFQEDTIPHFYVKSSAQSFSVCYDLTPSIVEIIKKPLNKGYNFDALTYLVKHWLQEEPVIDSPCSTNKELIEYIWNNCPA